MTADAAQTILSNLLDEKEYLDLKNSEVEAIQIAIVALKDLVTKEIEEAAQ